jgi:hypothetical protein
MLPRRRDHRMVHRVGIGRMEEQMKTKKNYYMENNIDRLIERAENRVVELKMMQQIKDIDAKLKALDEMRAWYPPHRADDEQPCALHTQHFPS